ncbi:MAG: carboxypeptidase regulatory-like domain-containing protein [Nitrospirae bacterium]|nr:carboxypeptidase regulatory-like domain-containing protein [Nitrospirota bacterium]MBI3594454.1 carboxypeptidase regulatory-like domain-containing protein [Nitrospirota bacterium]
MKTLFLKTVFLFLGTFSFVLCLRETASWGANINGSLTGKVRYFGSAPLPESEAIKSDSEVCGSNYLEETLVNFENKGVKNAIISLKKKLNPLESGETEKRIYLISKKCHIEPYVTAIQVENSLSIENSDPILHVLKFSHKDQVLYTLPLPPHGKLVKKINQLGLIQTTCVIHSFMKSYIAVLDTPNYLLSDLDGSFRFQTLDPGKYRLSIWHKSFGSIEKDIEVPSGRNLTLNFELEQK